MAMTQTFPVTVTKHNGLGNDFLVLETEQVAATQGIDWPEQARRLCNRVSGIGADGLLLLGRKSDFEITMRLYNQDGSLAEMSGNGIRCIAQAATMLYGHEGEVHYVVHSDAGARDVVVTPRANDANIIDASVDMGPIGTLPEADNWKALGVDPMRPVAHLSVGNPHAVVGVEDVHAVPLQQLGEMVPHINLEIVEPGPENNAITMRVHERGAGITQACGTGACASAWAAVQWGLVSSKLEDVIVHMDGGDVRVRVNQPQPGHVTLIGSVEFMQSAQVELLL
jgi:diaminopimelate epimerase